MSSYQYMGPDNQGWTRVWDIILALFGSIDGWDYLGSTHEHQFKHHTKCYKGAPKVAGQTVTPYDPLLTGIGPSTFFYIDVLTSDWLPVGKAIASPIEHAASSTPVNDYTCKHCRNDKCSKSEKSCWRCGERIVP